jgi:3-deoxy-D-manno-octulosonic-acid transferase
MSLALAAYGLLTAAAEPLAPGLLARRAARGKEEPGRLHERLGRPTLPRPPGDLVWLHGASVGESISLLPLIEALARERPHLALLITSGTVTSAALMAQRLPPGALHQYAPIDGPAAARRFLAHWRPALAIFVESELWPNLLLRGKASGARLALLGARISADAARGWARAPAAARQVLGAFDLILAQDALSRARLEALGARVAGELDLKQAAEPLPCDAEELASLLSQIGTRPVLVAASTHPGEEEMACGALADPDALLVIAPRHPVRADAIAAMLGARGLVVARRSKGERIAPQTQVYLADTLGEMGLILRLARVVVMGGSLTGGVGGHNPWEPARLGLPVITGADVANFRGAYAELVEADAAVIAADLASLQLTICTLMTDPDRAREMGERAKAAAGRGDGVLAAALAALAPLLAPGDGR